MSSMYQDKALESTGSYKYSPSPPPKKKNNDEVLLNHFWPQLNNIGHQG